MKPYQRRQQAAYPYYKLAVWVPRNQSFTDGKVAFATAEEALAEAEKKPGRYRISAVIDDNTRDDLAPFTIN